MFKKVKRYLADPYWALGCDLIKKHPNWMSDEFYLRTLWRMLMGYKLDLKNPKTFNEKLQWLKLYDRNPLYTLLVDKYRVKEWVAEKIGAEYVIPTLAVWENAEDIVLSQLPDQFVLKCNHDSGSVIICKDKSTFDIQAAKEKLGKALKHNFYWDAREWPYKNVKPLVFAEQYLADSYTPSSTNEFAGLRDYKFFCFDGIPRIMYIANDKSENPTTDFYDMEFRHLPIRMKDPNASVPPQKPNFFEDMKKICQVLSKNIPIVRLDFYETSKGLFFGEFTFYHNAGYSNASPHEWNIIMGDLVQLPTK